MGKSPYTKGDWKYSNKHEKFKHIRYRKDQKALRRLQVLRRSAAEHNDPLHLSLADQASCDLIFPSTFVRRKAEPPVANAEAGTLQDSSQSCETRPTLLSANQASQPNSLDDMCIQEMPDTLVEKMIKKKMKKNNAGLIKRFRKELERAEANKRAKEMERQKREEEMKAREEAIKRREQERMEHQRIYKQRTARGQLKMNGVQCCRTCLERWSTFKVVASMTSLAETAETANAAKPAAPTKVIVRLLPPNLTEEAFRSAVKQDILRASIWSTYIQGKRRKTFEKPLSVNSRAYLAFPTSQQAETFCAAIHGHSFIDEKGEAFRAVACYAPYPRVPRVDPPPDKRENTYETDPLYLEFCALRDKTDTKPATADVQEQSASESPQQQIAPLVLAIQEKRRQKQERLGQQHEKKRRDQGKVSRKLHPVVLLHKKSTHEVREDIKDTTPTTKAKGRSPSGGGSAPVRRSRHETERKSGKAHAKGSLKEERRQHKRLSGGGGRNSDTTSAPYLTKILTRSSEAKHPPVHILQRQPIIEPAAASSSSTSNRGKRAPIQWRPATKHSTSTGS